MREPSLRTSRLAIAGGLAAVIAVGGAGFMLGRTSATPEPPPVAPAPTPAPQPTPAPPVEPSPPMLDRAGIIALAAAAADATAAGEPLPERVTDAVNRRFTLHLPFGCAGPAGEASTAPLRWSYDEEAAALRLHVAPVTWQASDWWRGGTPPELEAIEGFWVNRPWTSGATCPEGARSAASFGFESVTLPGQTLAVAQFFPTGAARQALREGEPFETVVRVPPQELRARQGFRVRLTGRIDRVPGDGPVRCIQPAGIEQRPICIVAVSLEEVAIENPQKREVLAVWTIGRGSRADEVPREAPASKADPAR